MTALLDSPAKLSVSPHVLSAIRAEGCNLAVWERPTDRAFEALLASDLDDVRFSTTLSALAEGLRKELNEAGYPGTAERAALIDDIVSLAKRYGDIMQIDAVSVRLAVVTTNSCRKYHAASSPPMSAPAPNGSRPRTPRASPTKKRLSASTRWARAMSACSKARCGRSPRRSTALPPSKTAARHA